MFKTTPTSFFPITKVVLILFATIGVNLVHANEGGVALFSYSMNDPLGPANWSLVPIANNSCGGEMQSPIAIKSTQCTAFGTYIFKPGNCTPDQLNYTIGYSATVVAFPTDGSCQLNELQIPGIKATYQATQFHIHAASEHSINGQYHGAELHIVHKQVNGPRLAVVGVFLEPGLPTNNPEFEVALEHWNDTRVKVLQSCNLDMKDTIYEDAHGKKNLRRLKTQSTNNATVFNVYDLIPSGVTFYQYSGSLTTPPCSEIVDWNVAARPLLISVKQYTDLLDELYDAINPSNCEGFSILNEYGSSSRPAQPLNNRRVRHICSE